MSSDDPNQTPAGHRDALVVVTGASGFIASHVVRELLERGYRVRGTVRDPSDEAKTSHLLEMAAELGAAERLELVAGDLMQEGSFDDCMLDARFVCHMAAAVIMAAKDPQRQIVDVAVKGTHNVLGAVERAAAVETLVMTSSIAAVIDEEQTHDHTFTEADWNESASVAESPYPRAKVDSERAAMAWVVSQSEASRPRFVRINPVFVMGPVLARVHGRSSPAIMRDLLSGKLPGIPDFQFGIVDVRDVATAHVNALANSSAEGRYILHNRGVALTEMAAFARENYPSAKTPRFKLPRVLMYVAALFDKRLSFGFLRRNLGIVRTIQNERVQRELGIRFVPVEESLRDTVNSFYAQGLLP